MKTQKSMKRITGILMALVMVFALSGIAFASDVQTLSSSTDTSFTITVTDAANGETYTAYKIFDVTYTDEDSDGNVGYSYTIDSGSVWYSTVATATDVFTLTQVNGTSTYIVTVNENVEDDAIIAVFTEAGVPDGATAAATTTASGDPAQAVLDVTSSGAGYYYVTTSLGSLVMIDTTNPTPTIEEKNGIPTISKYVHENTDPDDTWGHEDDASNEDMILFELEVANINGAVNLVVHDSMDDELEIPDTSDFHMKGVTLYTSEGATGITLVEDTDYTVSVGTCSVEGCPLEDCAFEIHFLRNFDDVDATGYIEITYELLLDTENDAYNDDYEEIDNYALLSYGTTSFSAQVMAETFSYGFEIFKYTGSNEALEGVEFELKNSGGDTAYFETETIDGKTIYLFEGWTEPTGTGTYTQTLVTGSDGMIYIEGLDTGTYTLEETKALDGYNELTGPVTVTIEATYNDETGAMQTHTVTYTYGNDTGTGVVNIENNTGSILPGTGGIGTTIFYVIGGILVIGAAVLLITRRRMNRAE